MIVYVCCIVLPSSYGNMLALCRGQPCSALRACIGLVEIYVYHGIMIVFLLFGIVLFVSLKVQTLYIILRFLFLKDFGTHTWIFYQSMIPFSNAVPKFISLINEHKKVIHQYSLLLHLSAFLI